MLAVYFTESAKNASSAVTRLRRSDFIAAMYAFSFVFANFGIAMAAKMPMITTTIRSSISVKPLRFILHLHGWTAQTALQTIEATNGPSCAAHRNFKIHNEFVKTEGMDNLGFSRVLAVKRAECGSANI